MTRRCEITGKTVMVGNNVSHSNIKTKRRFLPNLQSISLRSDILDKNIKFKTTANGIRTIEHNFGLDNYILTTKVANLTPELLGIKKLIKKVLKNNANAS